MGSSATAFAKNTRKLGMTWIHRLPRLSLNTPMLQYFRNRCLERSGRIEMTRADLHGIVWKKTPGAVMRRV